MNYQAVLFDLDGVIVDSEPLHVAAFQATLRQHGHDLSANDYRQHFAGQTDQAGLEHYAQSTGQTIDRAAIMIQKAQAYAALAAHHLAPYPDVVDLIRQLAGRRLPLAVVTGARRTETDSILDTLGLTDLFRAVVTADDITRSKPDPQGYRKAAQLLSVDPGQCLAIEDSPKGVQAALAAGARCVAVTTTHTAPELAAATVILPHLAPNCLDHL